MHRCARVIVPFLFLAVASSALAASLPRPRLEMVADHGTTRIYVNALLPGGTTRRELLRETNDTVRAGRTGRDPNGTAAFVRWTEEATGEWSSASANGGADWFEARPFSTTIRLRDGASPAGTPLPPVPAGYAAASGSRLFLLQLRTVTLDAWRAALREAGVELFNYLPDAAFIARIDPQRLDAIRALDFVERVEPYHPWYRLDAPTRGWLTEPVADEAAAAEVRRVNVLALEWGPGGKQRVIDAAHAIGATVANFQKASHVFELWVDRAQLRAVAAHDDVMWVDFWGEPETDMDLVREDAGVNWLETNTGRCGQGVRGEVLDQGVQVGHPDFDGIILHGAVNEDSHGTSTYGIVFGNGNRDGDGSARGLGQMPCAQGIFADYDSMSDRFAHTQELKNAPYFASFQSNSWGNPRTRSYNSYSFGMDDIVWRLDIAILNSQSNAGNQDSRPEAWAKNVISVGGIEHKDTLATGDDCWCSDASIGPAEDGRIKPDINYWNDSIYTTTTGSGYTSGFGGTSAATPESAGVVGLMVQMWSENAWSTNPQGSTVFERQPHASTIKALAVNNAQQYAFSGTGSDLTRVHQGWGRPSVQIAQQRAARSFIINEEVVLRASDQPGYDVNVLSGEAELKITMVYNDPPGTTSATLHRINDLDLKVTSPAGVVYWGNNGLDSGNYSVAGGSADGKNNVENVFIQNPAAGTWRVEIRATAINQDAHLATPESDAVFALVVTGGTGSLCAAPTADFTITPNPARVGQGVVFDSTVSGGAGGPYTYAWDFDSDGVTDATVADPSRVYNRPYAGLVKLKVLDAAACSKRTEKAITVTGPDLRYREYTDVVEVQGNGNGAVDPGEVIEIKLRLDNIGNETAIGTTAALRPASTAPGPLSVLTPGDVPFGTIATGGTGTSSQAFRVQVGQSFPCGEDAVFTVHRIRTSEPANTYPEQAGVVRILVGGAGPPLQIWSDGFEAGTTAWTFEGGGEWQIGTPQGKGTANGPPGQPQPYPDPTSAFEGTKVLGNDLTGTGASIGNYESQIASTATSPVTDCSGAGQVKLNLRRWMNVAPTDRAAIEVSADGSNWTPVFSQTAGQTEGAWTPLTYDVSAVADRAAAFRFRFAISSDLNIQLSGWNVDSVSLTGVTRNSCQPFARATPGRVTGVAISKTAGALQVTWTPDCGGTAAAGIYRGDLRTGYTSLAPEPGRCGVTGTTATIPSGPGTADFFLVIPNDGGFEGSYGRTSAGTQRAPATAACWPRDRVNACAGP